MEEFSVFIDTLKKMYNENKIEVTKIRKLLSDKKITNDEYQYIIKEGVIK